MQLTWLYLIAAVALLFDVVSAAENVLTEINDASPKKEDYYDPNAPFKQRHPSQATLWNIHKRSFNFNLGNREDCQEVWLCSTTASLTKIQDFDPAKHKINSWCSDQYTRFRQIEGSVTIGLKAGDAAEGQMFTFDYTHVTLRYDQKSGNYLLQVNTKDRNINGWTDPQNRVEKQISLTGLPLILTSSPYCHPIVQDNSGYPVSSVAIGDIELAYPRMRLADAVHEKLTNVLVPTHITKYRTSKTVKCPPVWLPEYETVKDNWMTRSHAVKQKATYMSYALRRRKINGADCAESDQARFSVKLQIDDASKCNWIRLCFGEKDDGDLCADPKKSVELLLAYKMFVGIDSDEAQTLGNHWPLMDLIRFQWSEVGGQARFTMSYGFASDEGGVQHHMFGNSLRDVLSSAVSRVTLARDSECMARLVTDFELESPEMKGAQCLRVGECSVVIPEEFEKFPGSEAIKLGDYNPGD